MTKMPRWERRGLLRRTAIRPGRLAARLRVNVLLVISGLATFVSSALLSSSSSFFSWSSAREQTPLFPFSRIFSLRSQPFEPDLHRAIGRASSKAPVDPELAAENPRVLSTRSTEFADWGRSNRRNLLDRWIQKSNSVSFCRIGSLRRISTLEGISCETKSSLLSLRHFNEISSMRFVHGMLSASQNFEMFFSCFLGTAVSYCILFLHSFIYQKWDLQRQQHLLFILPFSFSLFFYFLKRKYTLRHPRCCDAKVGKVSRWILVPREPAPLVKTWYIRRCSSLTFRGRSLRLRVTSSLCPRLFPIVAFTTLLNFLRAK